MEREILILKSLYPSRSDFSDAEVGFVRDVLRVSSSLPKSRVHVPRTGCVIGGEIEIAGRRYRCEAVPPGTHWSDSCSGCDFARRYRNCDDVLCSAFDRSDGRFVWYREIDAEKEESHEEEDV